MARGLELAVFVITAGLGQICIYVSACVGKFLRLRDLGVTPSLTRRDALLWFPPPLLAAGLAWTPWYFMPVGFTGWVVLLALDAARPRPKPPGFNDKALDSATADRIISLGGTKAPKQDVIVADYETPLDLLRGMESRYEPVVVIPEKFARQATPEEIVALAARQVAWRWSLAWKMALAWAPMFAGLIILNMPAAYTRGELVFGGGLGLCAISFVLVYWTIQGLDFALDRAAITLTGEPQAYLRAIGLASRSVPATGRFPWWFKPQPLSSRIAAISQEFRVNADHAQP